MICLYDLDHGKHSHRELCAPSDQAKHTPHAPRRTRPHRAAHPLPSPLVPSSR